MSIARNDMTTDTKINEKKQRLLSLLREMFQLDQPDLDFGLYRIMHAKREQVETFLEAEFDQLIDKVFASRGARHEQEAKKEYEAARQQAIEFGAPDPEAAPKVQQARARYDVVRLTGGEDAEIYDHLHRFFSRYYDEGDFMSLRRYGKGAAGGAETYTVPYDGSEVVLHWANKDQYYIKTTENFSYFSFDPRKALQKDERGISRQLFQEVGTDGPALKVHLRVVDAAEGAHNNVKASEKDERYFLLDNDSPIVLEGTELVIRINYRPDTDKPSRAQKGKWQTDRNDQLVQKVLDALGSVEGDSKALAEEYRTVLAREVPKGKDKKQPLLARYVGQYTASNTMDYFIHKDLGGFLRRELDFYLKNEVLKLDDFVGSEDADVLAGLSEARMKAMQNALEKAQAVRLLSQRLIDFLAQLEDFQKKLWLKKKFVVEAHYCITLDRIPEMFYPQIAANDQQREEWVRLFAIDDVKASAGSPGYTAPLTSDFLKANQNLVLDTALFSDEFERALLAQIDGLDESVDGVLCNAENFQALNLMKTYYEESVSVAYIDPPYNTPHSEIAYKNQYKHSSWLSLVKNCLPVVRKYWTKDTFSFGLAIDDFEYVNLAAMLDGEFPELERSTIVVNHHPQGSGGRLSRTHEYYILLAPPSSPSYLGKPKDDDVEDRNFMRSGTGKNNYRSGRWKSFYALLLDPATSKIVGAEPPVALGNPYPIDDTAEGLKRIYPLNSRGEERVWRSSYETGKQRAENGELRVSDRGAVYQNIEHEGKRETLFSNWTDSSFNAGTNGTGVLAEMGLGGIFDYPKSLYTLETGLWAQSFGKPDFTVLDYFGGSGTTAHAVVEMNRKDSGRRRFVVVEMGDYFRSVLLPRVQKAIYSQGWKGGKPIKRDGISASFKYIQLESYEDCLNNLVLNSDGEAVANSSEMSFSRDYLLRYMLDVETQGSQSLLNVAQFRDPTGYQFEIKKPGSDERVKRNVDLVETFNWLTGLHVNKLHAGRRFAATFVRKPDPLLPEDASTRLQVETLTEAADGAWWFRPVEGYVRTKPGDDRHRQSVLVLWRTLTDDPEQDAAALEAFLAYQMKFDPTRREDKTLYDIIYINGTHNLPNLGKYGEVRLLEEEFHRRMWSGEDA